MALELEIFVLDRQAMFICGAWGAVTCDVMNQIEGEFKEPGDWLGSVPEGTETIRVSVDWVPEQVGEYGRVELAGYWELNLLPAREVR